MAQQRARVGFVSLGCPKNLVDTEQMIGSLVEQGFIITGDQKDAEVVVINTCGFLEPAQQEGMETIAEFAEKKRSGELKGLIVAGCMTERFMEPMKQRFPEVDAYLRTSEFSQVSSAVARALRPTKKQRQELVGEAPQLKGHSEIHDFVTRLPHSRPYAYVKISEGCNRTCSFCIIPKLRGKHHSRAIEGIVDEVGQLVAHGTYEVVLIAQDLTSYGRDLANGTSLVELLKALEEVEGLKWYRLMYNYPKFFTNELVEVLARSQKFSGYLDIPFQHASNKILKKMRRPESREEIVALVEKLRTRLPRLSLRTTLMVGFPGETEEDFLELLDFVKLAKFDHMGAFTYFQEKGTPSFDLPEQVDEEIKKERYDRLMKTQRSISQKKLQSYLGKTIEVVVDGVGEKSRAGQWYRARSWAQAPEVDGVTYVLSAKPRGKSPESLVIGGIYKVEIDEVFGEYDLSGKLSAGKIQSSDAEVAQLVSSQRRAI